MPEKKYKSKLREKFKARAKKDKADGRSLGYGDRTVGHKSGVSIPKTQRKSFFDQVSGKVKTASENRAREVLGGKLKDEAGKAHRGLTGIRHPAQLMPAIRSGKSLSDIIQSFIKK